MSYTIVLKTVETDRLIQFDQWNEWKERLMLWSPGLWQSENHDRNLYHHEHLKSHKRRNYPQW